MSLIVKIDRNSIKKNPDAGRTEYAIPGARWGRKTVTTEVGENFVVEEFVLCGEDQWRSVRKNILDSRFSALKPGEEIEFGCDVQHVRTITPAPSHFFEYIYPKAKCDACEKTASINDWSNEYDDDSGASWKVCGYCGKPLDEDVVYERISDVLKEMA